VPGVRGRLALASALAAVVIAGALTEGAVAGADVDLPPLVFKFHSLHLPGSNGYEVTVTGLDGDVTISADSPTNGASYAAAGTVTDDRIAADFGQFGSVGVTFTPHGEPRTTRRNEAGCTVRTTSQRGVYAGSIVFAGENGFSNATASSAPGRDVSQVVRCTLPGPASTGDGGGERGTLLLADGPSRVGRATLWATKIDGEPRPQFNASTTSDVGDVTVIRYASAEGRRGDFSFNRRQRSHALVTPPAPFTGSARFTRQSKGHTRWSGDLVVPLPGLAGPASLTGKGIRARMSRTTLLVFDSSSRIVPRSRFPVPWTSP
jgi:hypothetical protein